MPMENLALWCQVLLSICYGIQEGYLHLHDTVQCK